MSQENVDQMYEDVLDRMLTAPHVKKQLLLFESLEKKLQMVQLYNDMIGRSRYNEGEVGGIHWSGRDKPLLDALEYSSRPDIISLTKVKLVLSSADSDSMLSFLQASGLLILLKLIESRLWKKTKSETDFAVLYEVMCCFKVVLNNTIGMDGFVATPGAVQTVAWCLCFERKSFSLLVLEILSVLCYFSEKSAGLVAAGLRQLARKDENVVFGVLNTALLQQDVELKAAVMQFINSMLMGVDDELRVLLRCDLNSVLFQDQVEHVAKIIVNDQARVVEIVKENRIDYSMKANKELFREITSLFGPLASDESIPMHANSVLHSDMFDRTSTVISSITQRIVERDSKFKPPSKCIMNGLLVSVKNHDKPEASFRDILGIKRTKRRWYELDYDTLSWYGRDGDEEFKGSISVGDIIDIRPYTTNSSLGGIHSFGFEVDTRYREFAFGSGDEQSRDDWITAFKLARDSYFLRKGHYTHSSREMTLKDLDYFASLFRKQVSVYYSICREDRKFMVSSTGLNVGDLSAVSRYLHFECVASGTSSLLLTLLQQLLLIPASGAEFFWIDICSAVKAVMNERCGGECDLASSGPGKVLSLDLKASLAGSSYSQMSKLALAAMSAEVELQQLKLRLQELEIALAKANGKCPLPNSGIAAYEIMQPVVTVSEAKPGNVSPPPSPQIAPLIVVETTEGVLEDRYTKYRKMKKMLPEGAVRQKMSLEGFTSEEIDNFMSGAVVPSLPVTEPVDSLAKYRKMRQMLPEGAVRQKMTVEGVAAAEIDAFFADKPLLETKLANTESTNAAGIHNNFAAAVKSNVAHSKKNDPIINVLSGANGDSSEVDVMATGVKAVVVSVDGEQPPENMLRKVKFKPRCKLKGLFWTKIPASHIKNTLWYMLEEFPLPPPELGLLEQWFAAAVPAATTAAAVDGSGGGGKDEDGRQLKTKSLAGEKLGSATSGSSSSSGKKLASVVDSNRARTISIVLGKLRLPPEQVLKLVVQLDPENLSLELTTSLLAILPLPEELVFVQAHKDPALLDLPSKMIFHFNRVPRLVTRMECHEVVFGLLDQVEAADGLLEVLDAACCELVDTQQPLRRLLAVVLALGNHINGDTPRGLAYGVRLDVFEKLCHLKGVQKSGHGSLMQLLGMLVEKYQAQDVATFSTDWVAVWAAADISLQQVRGDISVVELHCDKLEKEWAFIKPGKENVALDGLLEDRNGPFVGPLFRRLGECLSVVKPKVLALKVRFERVELQIEACMNSFGESLKEVGEGDKDKDPCKAFFLTITTSVRRLLESIELNLKQRLADERKARVDEGFVLLEARRLSTLTVSKATNTSSLTTSSTLTPTSSDIFGSYHDSQEASSQALAAGFKNKLHQKFRLANS